MAIKLQSLYKAINNQFDVILHTNSIYDKEAAEFLQNFFSAS